MGGRKQERGEPQGRKRVEKKTGIQLLEPVGKAEREDSSRTDLSGNGSVFFF